MGYGVLGYIRPRFEWLDQFDHLTWSCELGVVKPDPAIYLHTLKKLQALPQQTLFIDNLEKNIVAAESVGLQALLFTHVDQLQKDLNERGFPLPPLI
jgi:putative hydrolase of the HAD superfamily